MRLKFSFSPVSCLKIPRFSLRPLSKFSVSLSSLVLALLSTLPQASAQPKTLLVAAASDLSGLQAFLYQSFKDETGYQVRFTFTSSGLLAQQIANGAPYDVFLSADQKRVKELDAAGHLVEGTVVDYAEGRLGLWSKSGRFKKLEDLTDVPLLHLSIANPAHAPYGVAAKAALVRAGLWEKLKDRVVYGESVRGALQFAESGNAEATITAWALVVHRNGVIVSSDLHAPILQSGAAVKRGNVEGAKLFLKFLTGPAGQKLLLQSGFSPVTH
jgi:molybdate transport system substrate-binding protein